MHDHKLLMKRLSPLYCYLISAVLARMATGGSAIGIVLLANTIGADGKTAGALAASLTAPHLFGPVYGRWLDKAKKPGQILFAAAIGYSVCFQLAIFLLTENLLALTFPLLLSCGMASSFLMGGLSTQLIPLVDQQGLARRRAQSWDNMSYGIGLTMGPLCIALLSQYFSNMLSVSLVMMLPACAAVFILYLPNTVKMVQQHSGILSSLMKVYKTIYHSVPLFKTIIMTSAAAFSVAALPVTAVYQIEAWQLDKSLAAYLVTFYGIGCLCGAVWLLVAPLKADAITLLRNIGCLLLVALILVSLSNSLLTGLATYWLTGVTNAIFFAATLAARTEYAPAEDAAQVYMWVAAAKITAASFGALVAGLLVDFATSLSLIVSCAVLAIVIMLCFVTNDANMERPQVH